MKRKKVVQSRGYTSGPQEVACGWILYCVEGKRHREKAGAKSTAITLYQTRKADAAAGRKLPNLRKTNRVTVRKLLDDVLGYVAKHKDLRNYKSRVASVRDGLGSVVAAALIPQNLRKWLDERCHALATFNRYKALISLAY